MLQLKIESLILLKNTPKPTVEQFDKFTNALDAFNVILNGAVSANETEEHIKKLIYDFLQNAYGYNLNTKYRKDAVLKNTDSSNVVVIFEAKRPQNVSEMITQNAPNRKAMHEALYYFMQERNEKNDEIKRVVITNGYEWFIFDAADFEKLFWLDNKFKKRFLDFESGTLTGKTTDHFYNDIAKNFLDQIEIRNNLLIENAELKTVYFDIRTLQTQNDKIAFFKALSKPYLLKDEARADQNHLNEPFYLKLLDIMGLEQIKNGSKKTIQRCELLKRNSASLLENAIGILKREIGISEDKLFDTALSLVIIWINRILFLKLLESTLLRYHKNNPKYRFLSADKLTDFDALNSLFFEVLAISQETRSKDVAYFAHIPYLNSSLFETTELEKQTIRISNLKDNLTYKDGKDALTFLFDFLDSYDFGAESEEAIVQTHKTIISASVLGLVFEKINGYKDGSFYTPSFITMYMAKEAITKAILQKFKTLKDWDCKSIEELYNKITDIKEANNIINSITICDPAVGSGHFLVSCLNEIIRTKAELGILCDDSGKRLKDYTFDIQNDELIVWDEENTSEFIYAEPFSSEASRVQKTLFNEKRRIIENQLFGVDINPNSVNICRLRLWIELLKNAYYKQDGKLDTLPNIDINIKCGNSLISRFDLQDELKIKNIKVEIENYKKQVSDYKDSITSKSTLLNTIQSLKDKFKLTLKAESKLQKALSEKLKIYVKDFGTNDLSDNLTLFALKNNYGHTKSLLDDSIDEKKQAKALKEIEELEAQIKEVEDGKIYENAFEWRFEFPEVLNEKGEFVGFDVVIGNPPYIPLENILINERKFFQNKYSNLIRKYDTSAMFFNDGLNFLCNGGILLYIAPQTWQTGDNYTLFRKDLINNYGLDTIINLPFNIFDGAYIDTSIYIIKKTVSSTYKIYSFDKKEIINCIDGLCFNNIDICKIDINTYKIVLNEATNELRRNLKNFTTLGEITISTQGLSGSKFTQSNSGNLFPFLANGNVYNYKLEINNVFYTDMTNYSSLQKYYEAGEKILIRRIISRNNRLTIGFTNEKLVFKKDINPFVLTDNNYSAKYILAILASKLISWMYLNSSSIATKDDFRQTTLAELRAIQIPVIDKNSQKPFIDIVDKILELKQQNKDTSKLEAQIDKMVYELYSLTQEEIDIVEESK